MTFAGKATAERLVETNAPPGSPRGRLGGARLRVDEQQNEAESASPAGACGAVAAHRRQAARAGHYLVPNTNQCKGCHEADDVVTRSASRRVTQPDFEAGGGAANQLTTLTEIVT